MGERARREVRRRADHALRSGRLPGALRLRGEGLRSRAVDRPQDGAAHGSLHAPRARRGPAGRGRLGHRHRGRCAPDRRVGGHGHRRPAVVPGLLRRPSRPGAGSRGAVLDPRDHPEPRRRVAVDRARHAGALVGPVHGLRGVEHVDRRVARRDQARPRRRDVLRGDGGADRGGGHGRVLGDARAVAAQRRSRAREPAVRRRARRLRDGRGGGGDRPRGARACPRARREDLRRGHRLRRLLRRESHHGARSPRPRPRAEDGARRRRHRGRRTSTTSTPTRRRRRSATPRRRRC